MRMGPLRVTTATGLVLLALAAVSPFAMAQSLGSVADKEKDRLKKNQDDGVKARVVTDDELNKDKPAEVPFGTPTPEPKLPAPQPKTSSAAAKAKPAGKDARSDRKESAPPPLAAALPVSRELLVPFRGSEPPEAPASLDWSERMRQARDRLAWALRNRDEVNGRLAEGVPRPVDENASYEEHDRLAGSPAQLRTVLLRVQIEIDVAQRTIEALDAEARRAASRRTTSR
jgi:hypothetical protein